MSSTTRQRKSSKPAAEPSTHDGLTEIKDEDNSFSLLDIARVITLLLCAYFAAGYFVTKEDIWWGHRPAFTKLVFWQDWFVRTPSVLQYFVVMDIADSIILEARRADTHT